MTAPYSHGYTNFSGDNNITIDFPPQWEIALNNISYIDTTYDSPTRLFGMNNFKIKIFNLLF